MSSDYLERPLPRRVWPLLPTAATISALALAFVTLPLSALSAATFRGLGTSSRALNISADGSTVVGNGFRWTESEGIIPLDVRALAVSADGSVIVGHSRPDAVAFRGRAARWTAETGIVLLPELPHCTAWCSPNSYAFDVSADGSVIVGEGDSELSEHGGAFRWTGEEGTVYLGDLPGATHKSTAYAVSADGSVITGLGRSASAVELVRWTPERGLESLDATVAKPNDGSTIGRGISADGSTIVGVQRTIEQVEIGEGISINRHIAFRWTESGGFHDLGATPGVSAVHAVATDASADGSVIVGFEQHYPVPYPADPEFNVFIWDAAHGMRNLQSVLEDEHGLNLDGWKLTDLLPSAAVCDDGRTIIGTGIDPLGNPQAWLVRLDAPVPEPGSLVPLVIGMTACLLQRDPKRQKGGRTICQKQF